GTAGAPFCPRRRRRAREHLAAPVGRFRCSSSPALMLGRMRRMFAVPFIAALLGGGVVAAVIAAAGGLGGTRDVTTSVQATPLQPSYASAATPRPPPHDINRRAP